ncbi:MAG: hypothetical protein ABIV39_01925 [Verrucomicrobiota bacterium]
MSDSTKSERRLSLGVAIVSFIPLTALVAGYSFLKYLRPGISDNYDPYREFWGGNPSEIFSHWLDMVLMSGGAVLMGWILSAAALFQRSKNALSHRLISASVISVFILSGVIAFVLDGLHGEGTVVVAYPIFFIPILVSSYYLFRQFAAQLHWRPFGVVAISVGFAALHIVAQLYYEPSGTGAPNEGIVLPWLLSVGGALTWCLIKSIRTGLFRRFFVQSFLTVRKPMVWGSTIFILLTIGVPTTFHIRRIRKAHERSAFKWLDELETKLNESFIEEIKRDHQAERANSESRIPISAAAHSLLTDARIKGDNAIRIYVPLNHGDYIFLWGNDRFEYCDIRKLVRAGTEEINQDSLMS